MLLAHLPNRSPLRAPASPADRSLEAPHLPFTLICRDADDEDSFLAFRRYAYLEDCIHDLNLALDILYTDADEHYNSIPTPSTIWSVPSTSTPTANTASR